MKLTSSQIVLYIIFIICILLIGYYYSDINNTDGFLDTTPTEPQQPTATPNATSSSPAPTNLEIQNYINNLDIQDIPSKNKIIDYLSSLYNTLDKYKNIDPTITINNNGYICENWDMYNNGKYKADNNNCIKIDNNGSPKCLELNNPVSCSKYYSDGKIDKLTNINIKDIIDSAKYNIILELGNIKEDFNKKEIEINKLVNELISKRNLENSQLYFIDNNNSNLDDKKQIYEKYNKDFLTLENDVNINKLQFKKSLSQSRMISIDKDKYYNYIIWLIILLCAIGIVNFSLTEFM